MGHIVNVGPCKVKTKKSTVTSLQRWARRRNWEKNQIEYAHKELSFRLNVRWIENDRRSQTQTDDEIEKLKKIISLLSELLTDWNQNSGIRRNQINFKQYK